MGEADPEMSGAILSSVDVEGMREEALDEAGLEALIARFERYVTELREFPVSLRRDRACRPPSRSVTDRGSLQPVTSNTLSN
ncbi:hypothetical protein [Streptomyces sp. 4F14]|uniref:hypothetical protein n=1 Tax=Streptomyces sp. 4F14 TaxID=3394380 RepID=UPI003A8609AF